MSSKLADLTETTTLVDADLVYTARSPFTSGEDRKITKANLAITLGLNFVAPIILATENLTAGTIFKGQPVAVDPSGLGVILANATSNGTRTFAIATEDILTATTGSYQITGLITQADWTAVTGSVSLIPLATYYLDIADGSLSISAPVVPTQIVQMVGIATSPDTLAIEIDQTVLL